MSARLPGTTKRVSRPYAIQVPIGEGLEYMLRRMVTGDLSRAAVVRLLLRHAIADLRSRHIDTRTRLIALRLAEDERDACVSIAVETKP